MIERRLSEEIQHDLSFFPVVAIIGPRQVGKTTLSKWLAARMTRPTVWLDLESEEDRGRLRAAEAYLRGHEQACVILDEVQVMPQLFPILRSLVDKNRVPARFILLGSASPELLRDSTESLAGRISYHELTPFLLTEIAPPAELRTHWLRGGFPEAFLAADYSWSSRWMTNFLTTFIERDLRKVVGYEINEGAMLRFVRMLSHLHTGQLNFSELSNSLDMSVQTVKKYFALLEGSFLINRLEPFHRNIGKRLTKTAKVYFRDSGFYHALMRVKDMDGLAASPFLGASWEGYVIEQVRRTAGRECEFFFYRTQNGAEIDLLIITPQNRLIAIEVKYSNSPMLSKGFFQSCDDLQPDFRYIITPDTGLFPYNERVQVCGLHFFLTHELPRLIG